MYPVLTVLAHTTQHWFKLTQHWGFIICIDCKNDPSVELHKNYPGPDKNIKNNPIK